MADEQIDNIVLQDAARMLAAAAHRLRMASMALPERRQQLINEAIHNIHAAEARIK